MLTIPLLRELAQIIGAPFHSPTTGKWGATPEDDERHWSRFKRDLGIPGVSDIDAPLPEDVLFLRLKERSVIEPRPNSAPGNGPDEDDIAGASFAGFYYIALKLNSSSSAAGLDMLTEHDACFSRSTDLQKLVDVTFNASGFETARTAKDSQPAASLLTNALQAAQRGGASLFRTNSYAEVVRGRSPSSSLDTPEPVAPTTPTSHSGTPGIAIPAAWNVKTEESASQSLSMASILAVSPPPAYMPSLEDFPPPTPSSPSISFMSRSRSRSASRPPIPSFSSVFGPSTPSPAYSRSTSCDGSFGEPWKSKASKIPVRPARSKLYNAATGYRGPFAHAVIKGFYFASSSDPYQELNLNYVGDGTGLPLEECLPALGGNNEWGDPVAVDEDEVKRREAARRRRFAAPRGLGSCSML